MKFIGKLIFIVFLSALSFKAQSIGHIEKTDSLKKLVNSIQSDKNKIPIYIELAIAFEGKDLVQAFAYTDTLLVLCKKYKNEKSLAETYVSIGNLNWYLGEQQKSMDNYLLALKIREKLKDERGIGVVLYNISLLYDGFGDTKNAIINAKKAIVHIKKSKDINLLNEIYLHISLIYEIEGDKEKYLYYFGLAEELLPQITDHHTLSSFYQRKAAQVKPRSVDSSFYYYHISMHHDSVINNYYNLTATLNNIGIIYADQGDFNNAIKFTLQSLDISTKADLKLSALYSFGNLASFYTATGKFKVAIDYYNLYNGLKKELNNEDNKRLASEIEAKFQVEKKELIIAKQKKENELKDVRIEKQEEENKRKNQQIFFIGFGLFFMIFVAVMIYRNLQRKKKDNALIRNQKEEIKHQKEEIEEKHREITDSIDYAQRIQSAILSSEDAWKQISVDSFVLFKPKDVVSGDFYWSHILKKDNTEYAIWCVADCTGHGVPGAFMSMLGISFLNEIVIESKIIEPNVILNKLREKVVNTLMKQSNEVKQRDGMDISLCVWNKKNNLLHYAGANNGLIIVSKNKYVLSNGDSIGNDEIYLHELKADRMPVGQYEETLIDFSSQTLQLHSGDWIYNYSDGYSDQFGGENGKKYRLKTLKNVLLEIANKSPIEQRNKLEENFNSWKGDYIQIDDVCLTGIKII